MLQCDGLELIADRARDGYLDDYRAAIEELVVAVGHNGDAVRAAAYQVLCLAEHNAVMQRLGFDPELNDATRLVARQLIADAQSR